MNIGSRIKQQRQINKINQEKLAEKLKMSRANIGHMETGKSTPTLESITIMCELFGVSSDYLIFGKEDTSEKKEEQPMLDIYRQLNPDNKAVCKYKAKELLKEQQEEVKTYEKKGIC